VGTFSGLPEKFEEGQIVEIANVGGLYVEHFIVLNSSDIGNFYFRIVYEKRRDDPMGVLFTSNSEVKNALKEWPVFKRPISVQCYPNSDHSARANGSLLAGSRYILW
jgi:hypothetical protein